MMLRTIAYNDYSIMVEIHQGMIFALFVESETLQLRYKLRLIGEQISKLDMGHSNVKIKSNLEDKITQEVKLILEK